MCSNEGEVEEIQDLSMFQVFIAGSCHDSGCQFELNRKN